jgi:hypothetical protein
MKLNPKPTIQTLNIDKDKLEQLQTRLKSTRFTIRAKYDEIKKVAGGVCRMCDGIPNKIVSFDMEGAFLIEKYCEKCFEKWDRLQQKEHME